MSTVLEMSPNVSASAWYVAGSDESETIEKSWENVGYNDYLPVSSRQETVEQKFQRLLALWRQDAKFQSSLTSMYMHPAYQQIVGLGKSCLPYILRELEHNPDYYFGALFAITGENPVPPEHAGKLKQMAEDWLAWARSHETCR